MLVLAAPSKEQFGTEHILAARPFATAVLGNGFIAMWGTVDNGGDISAVWRQQRNMQNTQASVAAFSAVQGQLRKVRPIQARAILA